MNLFHFIKTTNEPNSINKIYGIPYFLNKKKWPKNNGKYLHHIITLSIKNVNFKNLYKKKSLSIFFSEDQLHEPPYFKVITLENDSEINEEIKDYPDNYNPWWFDDIIDFKTGYSFEYEKLGKPNIELIEKVIDGSLVAHEILDDNILGKNGDQSYIGGFPIWTQSEEIPIDSNNQKGEFILKINGFNHLLELSPFGGADWYLFSGTDNRFYWVAQS